MIQCKYLLKITETIKILKKNNPGLMNKGKYFASK